MRLLTGTAGSDKTAAILDRLREMLRAGNSSACLLVPTATLALHLQNQLARESFVFPRRLIQTLNAFVETITGVVAQASETALYLIVEAAALRLNREEFARVVQMPGFSASLARVIAEFSSAGCDSARLAANLPDAPLSEAFLAVYREVDRDLARRSLTMRAKRLEIAAQRITASGVPGIKTIWLDGFYALPDPELRLIAALGKHAEVTLTLDESGSAELRGRLEAIGFTAEKPTQVRSFPALALVKAPNIEREAEEIARRILEQSAAGRPFREIGIIVRAAETYVPLLRSTLERFGIPARFYFDSKLDQHSAVRFLTGALDAMLGGWQHEETLRVLRLAPRLADSAAMDRFDFAVREQIPNAGLAELKSIAGDSQPLLKLIDSLAALGAWRAQSLTVSDWTARFDSLRNLFRPARPQEPADAEMALAYRSQAAALDAFQKAIMETTTALDPQIKLTFQEFWQAAKAALRLTPLRLRDSRRNVVQVIGAHEARQWSLPVVFVCGLVEKQFPQFHRQDPFFPDNARVRLNSSSIRVRTAGEFEREERALFDAAVSSARLLATLTYPEFDARGDRSLPSNFLADLHLPAKGSVAVRPQPRWRPTPRANAPIATPALLEHLRTRTARLTPSGLESYLQCAFQYFGSRILRLKGAPDRPEDRLSFLMQGNIVHAVLAAGYAQPETFERLFDEEFERQRTLLRIPNSYHTERLRNGMREDLLAFAADTNWPRTEFETRTEEKFAFPLNDSLEISGRIDRIDRAEDGRMYVIDYKYSAKQRTKSRLTDQNLLQAPLYMMAAERVFGIKPNGMFYIGLKAGVEYVGWSHPSLLKSLPPPENWLENARQRTVDAMLQIRAGRVEANPADPSSCRFCDCRDICRVDVAAAAVLAEGA